MTLRQIGGTLGISAERVRQIEIRVKYQGYVDREAARAARVRAMEDQTIPDDFQYDETLKLSTESREKLSRVRPRTIGQASRIPGVTASDLALLAVAVAADSHRPRPA